MRPQGPSSPGITTEAAAQLCALRRELQPDNALQPTCEDGRGLWMVLDTALAPRLDLTFTDELRAECVAFLKRITEYSPTLVLLKGTSTGDPVERWSYGAYAPSNLETRSPVYEEHGTALLYEVSGLTVAIPQTHLLQALEGKILARDSKGLELRERDSGI